MRFAPASSITFMRKHWFRWIIVFFFLFVTVNAFSSGHASGSVAANEDGNGSASCLQCHGPFENLASKAPSFTAPSGERITPHRYIPHNEKTIPDCLNCHQEHSENPTPTEIAALPKPTVNFCFECHHTETFARCNSCHGQGK